MVAVEPHLFVELASSLGRAVREDLQKIRIESAGNKDGFARVIAVDGPGSEEPTCESIFL